MKYSNIKKYQIYHFFEGWFNYILDCIGLLPSSKKKRVEENILRSNKDCLMLGKCIHYCGCKTPQMQYALSKKCPCYGDS